MSHQPYVNAGTPPVIRKISDALVIPIPSDIDTPQPLNTGVMDDKGNFVAESTTWRNNIEFSHPPREVSREGLERIDGSWMFGGLMFGHFGHFLVETTARLWAYEQLKDKIDGIVFVPKVQRRIDHVLKVYAPFLKLLDIDCKIINLPEPAVFETVHVPQQGFGMFGMIEGLPEYRDFMRERMGRHIADDGARRLYVSRSKLPHQRGGLMAEELVEEYLKAEGYHVIHPQLMSFEEQLSAYKSADYIVSADGSPLHMAALVAKPTAKIAVIARRPDVAQQFELQFRAFCGIETVTIDALKNHWIPVNHARPSRMSFGELDFGVVYDRLKQGGLITGELRWPEMTETQFSNLMAGLEERQRIGFKLFEGTV